MNGYALSRNWFNWAFDNKEAKTQHTALFMWIIELNNRLGWKKEFGLPTADTMEGLSIGNKKTYLSALKDLESWGFIKVIKESKNQYQSCIITICYIKSDTAQVTALDTALIQHSTRHSNSIGNGIDDSIVPIDKPTTSKPPTIKKETKKQVPEASSGSLHSDMKKLFCDFYLEKTTSEYYWNGKDASKVKSISNKLLFKIKEKNPAAKKENEDILKAFDYFLKNINDNWILENLSMSIVDSKFNEIISKIITPPKTQKPKTLFESLINNL